MCSCPLCACCRCGAGCWQVSEGSIYTRFSRDTDCRHGRPFLLASEAPAEQFCNHGLEQRRFHTKGVGSILSCFQGADAGGWGLYGGQLLDCGPVQGLLGNAAKHHDMLGAVLAGHLCWQGPLGQDCSGPEAMCCSLPMFAAQGAVPHCVLAALEHHA